MTARPEPLAGRGRSGALLVLTPWSVFASAPLWVVGLVVNEPAAYLGWSALTVTVIVSTLGYGVMAALMLAAERLPALRRLTGAPAVVVVALVIIVAAEARLAAVLIGFHLTGLPDDVPLLVRAVSSALLALVAFGYAGIALAAWAQYRDERERLLLDLLKATHRVDGHEAAVSTLSSALRETIRGRLAEARPVIVGKLDALRVALIAGEDGRRELEMLNSVADSRWRAISAETWKRFTPERSRASFSEFAWAYASTRPFSLFGVLLGAGSLTFFVFARTQAPSEAASSLAVWLVLSVVIAISTNALVVRVPSVALGAVLTGYGILMAYPVWLVLLGVIDVSQTDLLIRITVINVHTIIVMMIVCASPAIARNRHAVLSALRRRDRMSVHQLQIESRLLGVLHEVAATLHGSSRSAFMAESLKLEAALDRGDRTAAIALVDDVRATILEAEYSVDRPSRPPSPFDIADVIDNWRSVCEIDVRGSWRDVPESLLPAAHTVVVEGISDAMRHGDCSRIDIAVQSTTAGVKLVVTNDGKPVDLDAATGIGTALLDRLAPGAWRRDHDDQGRTRLTVAIAAADR